MRIVEGKITEIYRVEELLELTEQISTSTRPETTEIIWDSRATDVRGGRERALVVSRGGPSRWRSAPWIGEGRGRGCGRRSRPV
jgi:hypothetical protein